MSRKEFPQAMNFFTSVLHLSFSDFDLMRAQDLELGFADAFEPENEAVIEYLSGMMTNFLGIQRFFPADKNYGRLETITERLLAQDRTPQNLLHQDVGNFALFTIGMFPEYLKERGMTSFYEEIGTASYRSLHKSALAGSSMPSAATLYWMLAENFSIYAITITNARDKYMHFEKKGGKFMISPVYERSRTKGILRGDGAVDWLM
ncbi:MAG: hypothetical protein HY514_02430 [Candidatus Aenigmarchaeota archaeon]|nr:hypothetical protein [Candidatus Aenigmarchaeota archaeon]